jgi:hypothetical protein
MSLRPAQGAACSSMRSFELPTGARDTLTGASGEGDRLVEGDDGSLVECVVSNAGGGDNFNVSVRLSSGIIGNFRANGTVSASGGTLDVTFLSTLSGSTLEADDCVATVETVIPGALWIDSLECRGLRDVRSPGALCDSSGGLIFENCGR